MGINLKVWQINSKGIIETGDRIEYIKEKTKIIIK